MRIDQDTVLVPETVDLVRSRRCDELTRGARDDESNRRPAGTFWEAAVLPLNYTRSRLGFYWETW